MRRKTEYLHMRITPRLKRKLEKMAAKKGVSVSAIVTILLEMAE